jgi:SAM-dependent methyltransferase
MQSNGVVTKSGLAATAEQFKIDDRLATVSVPKPGAYVQYGCGFTAPKDWINFDASPTLRWEKIPVLGRLYTKNAQRFPANVRVGNIVKGLPVPENSCQGVYASHILEHLTLDEFHQAIRNTRRILRPGGVFRLVVPDLEAAAAAYLTRLAIGGHTASAVFLNETGLGQTNRRRGLTGWLHEWLRTSRHLWMWDEHSLKQALQDHGFRSVRRCAFGDCEDPMFALVEDASRFENAAAMEART